MSASASGADYRQAYAGAREAMGLARRYGLRSTLATAAGNGLESGVACGEWAWAETEAGRLLTEDLESFDRFVVYRGIEELRAYRGQPVDEMLEQHRQFVEADQGVTNRSNYAAALAASQFVGGHYREAIDNWVKSAELNSTNSGTDLPKAIRAALWLRDADLARSLQQRYEDLHFFGRGPSAWRPTFAAGLAALDGRRDEALALYSEAQAKWQANEVVFEGALLGIDMLVSLGPDEAAAAAMAADSRATLSQLGARPFVELIDKLTASTPLAAPQQAAATAPTR
jgi:tetratricopeptide (TPR) repeat protein